MKTFGTLGPLLMLCVTGLSRSSGGASIPVVGEPVRELAAFDAAMTNFMRANSIKGGALAVMKD